MTAFLLVAGVALLLVLALLLRPLLRAAGQGEGRSHRQLNTAIYREQLARLDQDRSEGLLAEQDHAQARAELQRRLLDDTQEIDAAPTSRAPRRTVLAIALGLPLAAAGLYLAVGNLAALSSAGVYAAAAPDVERMVEGLAAKLRKDPNNPKGWAMLARSYKAMERPVEAEKAFEQAGAFIDGDAQALADYADVAATNAGGRLAGKPAQLIAKALQADPDNTMAQWLAGTAALEAKDYARAIRIWERLAAGLPAGSEDVRMLRAAIDEVRAGTGIVAEPAPASASAGVSGSVGQVRR